MQQIRVATESEFEELEIKSSTEKSFVYFVQTITFWYRESSQNTWNRYGYPHIDSLVDAENAHAGFSSMIFNILAERVMEDEGLIPTNETFELAYDFISNNDYESFEKQLQEDVMKVLDFQSMVYECNPTAVSIQKQDGHYVRFISETNNPVLQEVW